MNALIAWADRHPVAEALIVSGIHASAFVTLALGLFELVDALVVAL